MLNQNAWGSFQEANSSPKNFKGNGPSRKKSSKRDLWDYEEEDSLLDEENDFYSLDEYEDDDMFFI